jgi:uncharacterized protein (TIGR02996 family)
MSDEAAFLAAIRTAPTDNLLRLVYADWLDEHDRPEGDYLRVECELADLDSADPRQDEVQARLRTARVGLDPGWLASISRVTRVEAERRVWELWGSVAQRRMGCEMLVEPELSKEYVFGWVVFLAPVRREDYPPSDPFTYNDPYGRFAIERCEGISTPVGTKGLWEALLYFMDHTGVDWRDSTESEIEDV